MTAFSIIVWYLFFVFVIGPSLFWLGESKPKTTYNYGESTLFTFLFTLLFVLVTGLGYLLWITGKHLVGLI